MKILQKNEDDRFSQWLIERSCWLLKKQSPLLMTRSGGKGGRRFPYLCVRLNLHIPLLDNNAIYSILHCCRSLEKVSDRHIYTEPPSSQLGTFSQMQTAQVLYPIY